MSIEEVTDEELTYLKLKFNWNDRNVRVRLAYKGIALNILMYDKTPEVRMTVAGNGYGADTLCNDPYELVRKAVEIGRSIRRIKEAHHIVQNIFGIQP